MKKIPKNFKLMGFDIIVIRDPFLMSKREAFGLCVPAENKIYVQEYIKGIGVSKDFLLQTFWHEAAHMLMHCMNEPELYANEKFIDILGNLLHQMHKSWEF